MNRKVFGIVVLMGVAAALLSTPSCARDQELVGLTLQPSGGFTFEGFGAQGQFTAYGSYIHPPETKDLSGKVVWTINIGNFGAVSATGLVTYTRTDGCGSGEVVATFYSNPKNPSSGTLFTSSAPVKGAKDGTAPCL